MKNPVKIIIVALLIVVLGGIILSKHYKKNLDTSTLEPENNVSEIRHLPRLLDLGADKCIPCKMMAPILRELGKEYREQFNVVFIDVWKNPEEAKPYQIKLIPTQIFFDAEGKERFRHEGFFSKEDILAKWEELGVNVKSPKKSDPNFSR